MVTGATDWPRVTGAVVHCDNGASWHPTMHTHQDHHHPPLAWRRLLTPAPWWRVYALCGLCHDEYHTLLNRYVKLGGPPPYDERRRYQTVVRRWVEEAWVNRPVGRLPYTLTDPFGPNPGGTVSGQSEPGVEPTEDAQEAPKPEVPRQPGTGATLPGGQRVATDEAK